MMPETICSDEPGRWCRGRMVRAALVAVLLAGAGCMLEADETDESSGSAATTEGPYCNITALGYQQLMSQRVDQLGYQRYWYTLASCGGNLEIGVLKTRDGAGIFLSKVSLSSTVRGDEVETESSDLVSFFESRGRRIDSRKLEYRFPNSINYGWTPIRERRRTRSSSGDLERCISRETLVQEIALVFRTDTEFGKGTSIWDDRPTDGTVRIEYADGTSERFGNCRIHNVSKLLEYTSSSRSDIGGVDISQLVDDEAPGGGIWDSDTA
jgi:hypothetical protein